jgi:hypothetical protein
MMLISAAVLVVVLSNGVEGRMSPSDYNSNFTLNSIGCNETSALNFTHRIPRSHAGTLLTHYTNCDDFNVSRIDFAPDTPMIRGIDEHYSIIVKVFGTFLYPRPSTPSINPMDSIDRCDDAVKMDGDSMSEEPLEVSQSAMYGEVCPFDYHEGHSCVGGFVAVSSEPPLPGTNGCDHHNHVARISLWGEMDEEVYYRLNSRQLYLSACLQSSGCAVNVTMSPDSQITVFFNTEVTASAQSTPYEIL